MPGFRSLKDFEAAARKKLRPEVFDYFAGGAMDEVTLGLNTSAFDRWLFEYSVFKGGGARKMQTAVLGQPIKIPILMAPVAFQRLAHEDGEIATARCAGDAGTIMVVSMLATTDIADIVAAGSGPIWMQLYIERDRGSTEALIRRAEEAGCAALVVTADSPVSGRLDRILRNDFHVPPELLPVNVLPKTLKRLPRSLTQKINRDFFESRLDPDLTWRDIDWIAAKSHLPVVVKGIVRPEDAIAALDHGARAIVVSNHGGRQLDTAVPSIQALPRVAEAVGTHADVLMDSGIRRGSHVLKAMALGAKAVLIGRPIIWGLACGGQEGVKEMLATLVDELENVMRICGCLDVTHIAPELLALRG